MNKSEVVKRKEVYVHEVSSGARVNECSGVDNFVLCSEMGKLMFLLLGDATSTQFIEWKEDVEATSLFKNPRLQGWRFW